LGEDLIAFRTTSGKPGIVVNACPHRGASLFFGRNEEEGLRCVYHGWKYDVTGACVDMPSEPEDSNFKTKVHVTAYPCTERNGVIWTYMGARETPPALPDLEPNMLPEGQWSVQKVLRECNWFQGLEGDIDTAHLAFLHSGMQRAEDSPPGTMNYYIVKDRSPRYAVRETEFGTSYGAYRPADNDMTYWRIAHFLLPFYTMIPTGVLGVQVLVRAWVPIDDEHMMFWSMSSRSRNQFGQPGQGAGRANGANGANGATSNGAANGSTAVVPAAGRGFGFDYLPETSDALGRFRLSQNKANDYLIDREAQRTVSFTGINGIHQQDQAITESMGPIYDRTREHLGTSDSMVIRSRRRAIEVAKALRDNGTVPPGVDEPEVYRYRSGGTFLPKDADWVEGTRELSRAFVEHTPELIDAVSSVKITAEA
jgi:phenylpropionate dioxygenase-like ring-hydroxylating dioxygenase large terminal subunit